MHVRDRIVSGQIKPGEHLVETRLSEELGVSRGTLREALRPLEQEELLVGDGKGHLMVHSPSSSEILEVFEVRAALEALAVAKLASRQERTEIVEELYRALAPLKDQNLTFSMQIEVDLSFHARVCELTNNLTLINSWHRLLGKIEMMIIAAGPEVGGRRMRYDEHAGIVEAIASGDAAHAQQILTDHMDDFSRRYVGDAVAKELGMNQ
jgi:DNA-binding GntR family transcriptional regulator